TRAKKALADDFILDYIQLGDLGLSRTLEIEIAKGDIDANFAGDDIWSHNWIRDGALFIMNNPNVIAHPAAVLNFGTKNGVWHIKDSTSADSNPKSLIEDNWWPSCTMAHKSLFNTVQYKRTGRERNFGF